MTEPTLIDMTNQAAAAQAWALLNNSAQLGSNLGPGTPVMPVAQELEPRWEQYNPGVNLNILPRSGWGLTPFQQLRNIAAGCKEIRLNIDLIKRTIRGFDWTIAPVKDKKGFDAGELAQFFSKPDGVNDLRNWIEKILEDLLVLDAVCIYPLMSKGKMTAAEVISADTIRINVDFRGRIPEPPAPAYFQVLWGMPRSWFARDRLIYSMMHPRTYAPYGASPIEGIIAAINVAIRNDLKRIGYYTEGNVPHSFVGLPADWNMDQIKEYQKYIDALTKGGEARTSQFIFIPHEGGSIPVAPFTNINMDSVNLDEFLLKYASWAYGNSTSEFGLVSTRGLGQSGMMQSMEGIQFRSSIDQIVHYVQDLVTHIIQVWLKRPDAKFVAVNVEPKSDQLAQAQIDKIKIETGIYTAAMVQDRDGIEMTYRPPVEEPDVLPEKRSATYSHATDVYQGVHNEDTAPKSTGNASESITPINDTMVQAAKRGLKIDLNTWQDAAERALDKGWQLRPNTADTIPDDMRERIEKAIHSVNSKEEIKKIFDAEFDRIKKEGYAVFQQPLKKKSNERFEIINSARLSAENVLVAHITPVLQKEKRLLEIAAQEGRQQSAADQKRFEEELTAAIILALILAVSDFGDIENLWFTSHGYGNSSFAPSVLLAQYQESVGRNLSEIGKNTLTAIQNEFTLWDGKNVAELMARLDPLFSQARAEKIAQFEIGNIAAFVLAEAMRQNGLDEWEWVAEGEHPCSQHLVVDGREWGGCIELDGNIFGSHVTMPPEAAHLNCRCVPSPVFK